MNDFLDGLLDSMSIIGATVITTYFAYIRPMELRLKALEWHVRPDAKSKDNIPFHTWAVEHANVANHRLDLLEGKPIKETNDAEPCDHEADTQCDFDELQLVSLDPAWLDIASQAHDEFQAAIQTGPPSQMQAIKYAEAMSELLDSIQ